MADQARHDKKIILCHPELVSGRHDKKKRIVILSELIVPWG